MGGAGPHEGRVEVFHWNQWGTVCDIDWSIIDALVVCRQLGYTTAVDAPVKAAFGPGRGPVWLGDVACSGSETNITQCGHVGLAASGCEHDEDASVVCASEGHGSSKQIFVMTNLHSFTLLSVDMSYVPTA